MTVPPDEVADLGSLDETQIARWQALVDEYGGSHFCGPIWGRAWYEHFGDAAYTRVGIWREGETVVALAPMVRVREAVLPAPLAFGPRLSAWRNLGAGEASADHLGFPSRPDLRGSVMSWALSLGPAVRLANLDQAWAPVTPRGLAIRRNEVRTYRLTIEEGDSRPGSKKLWKNIAWGRRRLSDQGVHFDVVSGTEIDESVLTELFELHATRSAAADRNTTFTSDRLAFHARLARDSDTVHKSVMITARQGPQLVGSLYGFIDATSFSYYQSGWSPEFERWSLGSVLLGEAFDTARRLGLTTFDLLRGDEAYKTRFGATIRNDVSVLRIGGTSGAVLAARDALLRRRAQRAEKPLDA